MSKDVFTSWASDDLPDGIPKTRYDIIETGESGSYSARRRFRVVCTSCHVELHEGTTNPSFYIRIHEDEVKHAS